jgi:hypothetical protein
MEDRIHRENLAVSRQRLTETSGASRPKMLSKMPSRS